MTQKNLKEFIISVLEDSGFENGIGIQYPYESLIYLYDEINSRFSLWYKNYGTPLDHIDYLKIETLLQNIEWYQDAFLEDNSIPEEQDLYVAGFDPFYTKEERTPTIYIYHIS